MSRLSMFFPALALAFSLISAAAPARADDAEVLNQAMVTIDRMKTDPMFGPSRQFLRNARAVLIIPRLLKGGFIFGAEGGDGVMFARLGRHWSGPAFYTLGSASFGLQIGLEQARFVMFIMTDRALRAVEASKFTFGGAAGLTVISLGAGVQAATSANLTGDIVVWSASKGAYGGLTLQGSVLAPKPDANARYYGRPISVPQILSIPGRNPASRALQLDLETL